MQGGALAGAASGPEYQAQCSVCGPKILLKTTGIMHKNTRLPFSDKRTQKFSGEGAKAPFSTPTWKWDHTYACTPSTRSKNPGYACGFNLS